MSEKKYLGDIQFFNNLEDDELDTLNQILKRKVYSSGDVIFRDDEAGEVLYVIKRGEVKVCKGGPNGELQTITILKDGDICGEMSFLDGRPHSATVIAIVETEIYQLKKVDFDKLIYSKPMLVYKIMRNIIFSVHAIVRGMNARYVDMVNYMWGRRR